MCPGLPTGLIGDRDKGCASDSAENECGLWESSSYPCPPCVLFILTILEVSFLCTGKWWARGLSQLLTTVWKTTLGTRQELPQNRGLNNRERMFKTSFSQFSVRWLPRGQWSKPQGNWQRPCRCLGSLDAALAQLPAALSPRESGSPAAASAPQLALPAEEDGGKERGQVVTL